MWFLWTPRWDAGVASRIPSAAEMIENELSILYWAVHGDYRTEMSIKAEELEGTTSDFVDDETNQSSKRCCK